MRALRWVPFMDHIDITSPDDPRLDPFRSIKGKSDRGDGMFVAESEIVLDRLLESSFRIQSVLVTPARANRLHEKLSDASGERTDAFEDLVAPQTVIDDVVGYPLHRGVITLAERHPLPSATELLARSRTVLVLEDVADPENIGSMFRHAAGFGVDAVILHGHCGDPLYRKTIRTSMGWTLCIPYCRITDTDGTIGDVLAAAGFVSLALTPSRGALSMGQAIDGVDDEARIAIVVGAEGPGLKNETMAATTFRARIPICDGVDSLNVSTSAAIALFALTSAQPSRLGR